MRTIAIPFALWLGVLQLPPGHHQPTSLAAAGTMLSVATALAGLTAMVYRLGVWRQQMENTEHNIGAEIVRLREESARQFEQLDRRLSTVESGLERLSRQYHEHRPG